MMIVKKMQIIVLITIVFFATFNFGNFTKNAYAEGASTQYEVTFNPNNGEEAKIVTGGEPLVEGNVPFSKLEKEGYDFLGWFYGTNLKYEVIFPFQPEGNMVLTAKWGKHTAPSPIEKEGYRLIFNDEFNQETGVLDPERWVDKYLSSWTRIPELASPTYEIKDGAMVLQIHEDTRPWAPEFDGQTVVSGFTTGNRNALHNWNGNNVVRNPVDTEVTHINQYGFYEIRAKGQAGSSRHAAWWLTGFEDSVDHSAEIDIFEVLGRDATSVPRAYHGWNDPDAFNVKDEGQTYRNSTANFHDEWHTYGMDWQEGTGSGAFPDRLVFYVDGIEVGSKNVNIDYPMIQLFSLYEKRAGGWTGPWEWMPYPNSFEIDYVRVYKKLPENQPALSASELEIVQIEDAKITVQEGKASLKKYTSAVEGHEGEVYTEPNLPNTPSYVNVNWNDGVVTQEFVKWDPITVEDLQILNSGKSITKNGVLPNSSDLNGAENPTLVIDVTPAPPPPPYASENLGKANSQTELAKLFDGNLKSNSGEFIFEHNYLPTDKEVNIQYDFNKNVELQSIAFSTNYGQDQGIRKFKVAAWNAETNSWDLNSTEYSIPWTSAGNTELGETKTIDIIPIETTKVKIILTDVGLKWINKMAMREIAFQYDEVVDKSSLKQVVEETEQKDETTYTEESWSVLKVSLAKAKEVIENEAATQTEVDAALHELTEAIQQLVKKPSAVELESALKFIEKHTNEGNITTSLSKQLSTSISSAIHHRDMGRQEQALKHLQDAIKHFEKAKETDIEEDVRTKLQKIFSLIEI